MGVDLKDGEPQKWLVENSWGESKGKKGQWTLQDDWFTEHVYVIIVNQKHLSEETAAIFKQEPSVLPAWYPGGALYGSFQALCFALYSLLGNRM